MKHRDGKLYLDVREIGSFVGSSYAIKGYAIRVEERWTILIRRRK
jgi:hypothetical protein